jgi:hypothetical protein
MITTTIRATYRGGVLQPETELVLPENTTVELEITPLPQTPGPVEPLFGAFPALAELTDDDFAWARRLWEHGFQRELRLLDELE